MLWGARTAASRQRAFGREPEFGEAEPAPGGRTIRGDQGRSMLGQRIASKSEVIRAIVSGCSRCCGVAAHRSTLAWVSFGTRWWKVKTVSRSH